MFGFSLDEVPPGASNVYSQIMGLWKIYKKIFFNHHRISTVSLNIHITIETVLSYLINIYVPRLLSACTAD